MKGSRKGKYKFQLIILERTSKNHNRRQRALVRFKTERLLNYLLLLRVLFREHTVELYVIKLPTHTSEIVPQV